MANTNWSKVLDGISVFMVWVGLIMLVVCVLVLLLLDTFIGAGSMMVLTGGNVPASLVLSMATTGLLTSLAFIGYLAKKRDAGALSVVAMILVVVAMSIDIYFDSLTADILRYNGQFVSWMSMPAGVEKNTHLVWRTLIAILSLIGEFLAFAIIVGMPELKKFFTDNIPVEKNSMYNANSNRRDLPNNLPRKSSPGQGFQQKPKNNGNYRPQSHTRGDMEVPEFLTDEFRKNRLG